MAKMIKKTLSAATKKNVNHAADGVAPTESRSYHHQASLGLLAETEDIKKPLVEPWQLLQET